MIEHHCDDTPFNLYLIKLRNLMYQYLGVCSSEWMQRFEDKFYECLNATDDARYRLGMVLALSTLKALCGQPMHLQDVLEQLG